MDLIASIVAFVSVRKADEPADAGHPYGHQKLENMAGAIEGTLVLFGAAIITYEALARLVRGGRVHTIGVGIAVIVVSAAVNLVVSRIIARRARQTGSVALEADATHLSADVASSMAVLVGLVAVALTHAEWIDPAVALVVAAGVAFAGGRILLRASRSLVDEALPPQELEWIRSTIREIGAERGVVGFHKLRARRAGTRRYVDVHLQFASATTLEGGAPDRARGDQRDPRAARGGRHPGACRAARPRRAGDRDLAAYSRLIAAAIATASATAG